MFLKPSKALVVERINLDNGTAFTPEMLNFGPIVVLPDGHDSLREISVLLTPTPIAKRKGQRKVYYNRYDLSEEFGEVVTLLGDNILTEEDAIALFNSRFQAMLSTDDVIVVEFENGDLEEQPNTLTFIAKPNSYAYKGEVSFGLFTELLPLEDIIVIDILDGLHFPLVSNHLFNIIPINLLNGLYYPDD